MDASYSSVGDSLCRSKGRPASRLIFISITIWSVAANTGCTRSNIDAPKPPSAAAQTSADATDFHALKQQGKKPQAPSEPDNQNPLGDLFGAATKVLTDVTKSARPSGDALDATPLDAIIRTAGDGIDAALAQVDDRLPQLDPEVARKYGNDFRKATISQYGIVSDKRLVGLVVKLWEQVVRAANEKPASLTLTIVEDRENNAYAFVGRNIVVNRGFIDFAQSCVHTDDMIRFALAHELAHIVLHHTDRAFQRKHAAEAIVPGSGFAPAMIEQLVKQTPINQASERAADCFAFRVLTAGKWSLKGGQELFTQMLKLQGPTAADKGLNCLFASHPDEKQRIKMLDDGAGCRQPADSADSSK